MRDPYIRYRYLSDKRVVEAQCSAAHRQISTGAAEPLEPADRATYVEWCRETGATVAAHVPFAVAESKEKFAAKVAAVLEQEYEGPPPPATKPWVPSEPAPELIPGDFPHAAELAAAGIYTFDKIPADFAATRIKGVGRSGASKIARALAARSNR